jgi:hypothetical protein
MSNCHSHAGHSPDGKDDGADNDGQKLDFADDVASSIGRSSLTSRLPDLMLSRACFGGRLDLPVWS